MLWKGPDAGRDLFVIDDLVWMVQPTPGVLQQREEHWPTLSRQSGADLSGYHYRTGQVTRTIEIPNAMSPGHHLRCYRSKATERFILYPKRGAEFLDLHGSDHMRHDWLRGSCRYGVLPCNGLLYTPPDQCFCYIGAKMNGLVATSSADTSAMTEPQSPARLRRGPAYGKLMTEQGRCGRLARLPSQRETKWFKSDCHCLARSEKGLGNHVGRPAHAAGHCGGKSLCRAISIVIRSRPSMHGPASRSGNSSRVDESIRHRRTTKGRCCSAPRTDTSTASTHPTASWCGNSRPLPTRGASWPSSSSNLPGRCMAPCWSPTAWRTSPRDARR